MAGLNRHTGSRSATLRHGQVGEKVGEGWDRTGCLQRSVVQHRGACAPSLVYNTVVAMDRPQRGQPLPETPGNLLIRELLDEIEIDERLGRSIGVDLTPAGPDPSHAPRVYPPLSVWLERADEVQALREAAWRADRAPGKK